jgi:shikimate kinase
VRKGNIIFLTGFMGPGKSEVGKRLAERLGWRFVDTDALIEREEQLTIPEIFAQKGEPYFRMVEGRIVEEVCGEEGAVVVATGGGAIVDEENRQRMQESGVVVCLAASPEVILTRVGGGGNRPLLQGGKPLDRVRSLLSQRAAAYARADISVETSDLSVDEVVEEVLQGLRTKGL